MPFQKEVVIDARAHLLGRLSSVVAKELLLGQKVTVVRCEDINQSGTLFRNKLKYHNFLRKTNNVNPKHGPFHYRQPSKMFKRVVRGMVPHKTARGQAAMDRLTCYEGIPHPYDMKKKQVVPQALRVLRMKPHRKYCKIGDLSKKQGWKHQSLIASLEDKRREKANKYFARKVKLQKVKKNGGKAATGKLSKEEKELVASVTVA